MVNPDPHNHIETVRRTLALADRVGLPRTAHPRRALLQDLTDMTDLAAAPSRRPAVPRGASGHCAQPAPQPGIGVHRARCWASPLTGGAEQDNPGTPPAATPRSCGRRHP